MKYVLIFGEYYGLRVQYRQKIVESMKSIFKLKVSHTFYWDGKMIEDISEHEIIGRLPILVIGKCIDQLVVSKLIFGTGKSISLTIHQTLLL